MKYFKLPNPGENAVAGASGDFAKAVDTALYPHHPTVADFPSERIGDDLGNPSSHGVAVGGELVGQLLDGGVSLFDVAGEDVAKISA